MLHRARRFDPRLAALALFAVAAAAFCWTLWAPSSGDRMMVGPAGGDYLRQFYPYRAFVARSLASGVLPLWNPHQYAGTPALADPQLAVLYPWRLLQAPLAMGGRTLPVWAVDAEAIAHLALAGWFTFLLLGRLGAGTIGALFGGLTYAFGGYLAGYPMEQLAVLDTAAWLPASLWALTRAMAAVRSAAPRTAARWTVLAAVATALSLYAGHPQTALYGVYAAAVWWLYQARRPGTPRRAALGCGLGWLALAAGLSAAQWMPTLALSARAAQRFEAGERLAGLPLADAVQLLVPNVVSQWSPLFVGTLALVLAVWAALRVTAARFWVALAAAAWLLALGGANPLFPLILRWLPGLALFRHHERVAVIVGLGLSVAAGLAVGALRDLDGRRLRTVAAWIGSAGALALVAAAMALAWPGPSSADAAARLVANPWCADAAGASTTVTPGDFADGLALAALVLLAASVAVATGAKGDPSARVAPHEAGAHSGPPSTGARGPDLPASGAHARDLAQTGEGASRWSGRRVAVPLVLLAAFELFAANQGRALCPQEHVFRSDPIQAALAPRARDGRVSSEALLPGGANAASVFDFFDVTGDSPLRLRTYADLEDHVPEIVRWRLLGVRAVVTDRTFPANAPVSELARTGDSALYETRLAVPPAWVPERVSLVAPGTDWPFAPAADFDPLASAPFEADLPHMEGGTLTPGRGADAVLAEAGLGKDPTHGEANLVGLSPGHIAVEATLDREGVVVQSTTYDPGWRATAGRLDASGTGDGRLGEGDAALGHLPVRAAYGALLAVALPAGRWRIEWTYLPIEVIVGFAVTGIALLAGVIAWRPARTARR